MSTISHSILGTLLCAAFYLLASPSAILVNRLLMKEFEFPYPILVSALGQVASVASTEAIVRAGFVSSGRVQTGVDQGTVAMIGCASALTLVFGQYPYLYLTISFVQMLKAFKPGMCVTAALIARTTASSFHD